MCFQLTGKDPLKETRTNGHETGFSQESVYEQHK